GNFSPQRASPVQPQPREPSQPEDPRQTLIRRTLAGAKSCCMMLVKGRCVLWGGLSCCAAISGAETKCFFCCLDSSAGLLAWCCCLGPFTGVRWRGTTPSGCMTLFGLGFLRPRFG